MIELLACGMRPVMTDEEIIADFMRNEGRQTEEWPDFGTRWIQASLRDAKWFCRRFRGLKPTATIGPSLRDEDTSSHGDE